MKKILIFMTVITFVSCTSKEPKQMTAQELDGAKKEIKNISDQMLAAIDKLDLDAFFKDFSNSAEFLFIGTDGKSYDFQSYVDISNEYIKPFSASRFILNKSDFRFLSNDLMLYIISGTWDLTFTTGDQMKFDTYTINCLFKKIENQWKVIFLQESASPATEIPKAVKEEK